MWVDIEEDAPLRDMSYRRLSVPIDILMKDGTIHKNGFCTVDTDEYYTSNSKKLDYNKVKGWRTRC